MIALSVLSADDWRLWRELRLEALREAPYAFGATLSDWQGAGDADDRWRARLSNVPFNIVARLDGVPAGIVGATALDERGDVELISMWVAPFARGRGVGNALIDAVIEWSVEHNASRIVLAVREENRHAINLYRRAGFIDGAKIPGIPEGEPRERLMIYPLTT